jgi:putative ABC transport system permease protein
VRLDGRLFPIVGVAEPDFLGVEIDHTFEVAVPLCSDPMFWEPGKGHTPSRTAWWLSIMGRLKPGWTLERANAQIQAVSPAIMRESLPGWYRAGDAKKFLANKLTVTHASGSFWSRPGRRASGSVMRDRLMAALAGGFGLLAGLLAVLGLYGVIAYMVARRRNEIGVRIALGASRGRVIALVLREAILLLAVGLTLGRASRVGWASCGVVGLRYETARSFDARWSARPAGDHCVVGQLCAGPKSVTLATHGGTAR